MQSVGSPLLPRSAIVIGAGFVGTTCALNLQRSGWQVTLIDKGNRQAAASWGNAGHLATEQTMPLASWATVRSIPRRLAVFGGPVGLPLHAIGVWLPFGLQLLRFAGASKVAHGAQAVSSLLAKSMSAWQNLVEDLGCTHLVNDHGHFVVWESKSTAHQGQDYWLNANIGTTKVRLATAPELQELKARFNGKPIAALRFFGSGQIVDIPTLQTTLQEAFLKAGGTLLMGSVQKLDVQNRTARVQVQTDAGIQTLDAEQIIVAGGAQSVALMRDLKVHVPLIAERGYHIEVPSSNMTSTQPKMLPVAFEDRSIIVTHFASSTRLAGFTEFNRFEAPADPKKWERLTAHGRDIGLSANLAPSMNKWIGARPTLPDYLPAIGRCSTVDNVIYAFGHQHLGVTLAAITGQIVTQIAQSASAQLQSVMLDGESFALDAFNINRFTNSFFAKTKV